MDWENLIGVGREKVSQSPLDQAESMGAHTELAPCFCKYVRLSDLPAAAAKSPQI